MKTLTLILNLKKNTLGLYTNMHDKENKIRANRSTNMSKTLRKAVMKGLNLKENISKLKHKKRSSFI